VAWCGRENDGRRRQRPHFQPYLVTFAFRLRHAADVRSIRATAGVAEMEEFARGADVLVHMVPPHFGTELSADSPTPAWDSLELADLAARAGVKNCPHSHHRAIRQARTRERVMAKLLASSRATCSSARTAMEIPVMSPALDKLM